MYSLNLYTPSCNVQQLTLMQWVETWFVSVQEYRTKKKMEHVMKAAVFGRKTISVVDPHRYAKRFRGFLEQVFVKK